MGRTGVVAAAAAVVLLAAVGCTREGPSRAATWDESPRHPAEGSGVGALDDLPPLDCRDPAGELARVPGVEDVVAARMCATEEGVAAWTAPQDVVGHGLSALLTALADAEPMPEDSGSERYFCQSDGGHGFDLRLALASGAVVSVPGDTGGCSTVRIGGRDLVGADEVLVTFHDAVESQRESAAPPRDVKDVDLACGSPGPFGDHVLSLVGDPRDLVTAISCSRPDAGDDVGPWEPAVTVPEAQLRTLVADMGAHARVEPGGLSAPGCPRGAGRAYYWQDLVGTTRWGDVVAARGFCRAFLVSRQGEASASVLVWRPSPRAQRILDGLRR